MMYMSSLSISPNFKILTKVNVVCLTYSFCSYYLDSKEELDWRNSRQPPHLKSQYAAQYGIDNFEEDAMVNKKHNNKKSETL